ncbi:hypothetical protein FH5_02882 [Priestia endophytica]|nr:hypothetical protein FH5_02882 [Priestia endophytica]
MFRIRYSPLLNSFSAKAFAYIAAVISLYVIKDEKAKKLKKC